MKNKVIICILAVLVAALSVWTVYNQLQTYRARLYYSQWQKINLVLSEVEKNYVEDVDRKAVTDAALAAALQKLDPHSVYMTPEPLKEAEEGLAGGFEGIGIQFNVPNDTAVVISVIPGGPSEKAGILSGDRLLKADDRVMAGVKMPQDTMVRLMKGPKGTKVKITIGRGGEEIPFDIVRDRIPEHCVDAAFMINDTTGYLRLSKFTRTTHSECLLAMAKLSMQGMKNIIFDVRDNSGGYYDQACQLANAFLPKGADIVYMEGKHRKREDVKANGRGEFQNIGISVLINDGSASASEILAGAIQDNDRGVVVGRRSYGKGLVQEPMYFSDGSGVRLTIARYHTPSGRCIQKPYDKDDYAMDLYRRYADGEMVSADSIKVDSSKVYWTVKGRPVYGGGGIIPDVFVGIDTTRANDFHIQCNRKSLVVRYSTRFLDSHRAALTKLDDFDAVKRYLDSCPIEQDFLAFAASQGVKPVGNQWQESKFYLLPQIKGLCARYTQLGEEAYYRYILPLDETVNKALEFGPALPEDWFMLR